MVMKRFDVFKNPRASKHYPFVVVVQHELMNLLPTRLVIPLIRRDSLEPPISGLNPCWRVEGIQVALLTQQMGAVSTASLKKPIGSLAQHGAQILRSIDILLSGI